MLELTLEDALRIALEQNLDLEIEKLATDVARYDALGSWGSFDPVLSLTGTLSDRESPPTDDFAGAAVVQNDSQALEGSLVQPLTTGGDVSLSYTRTNFKTNSRFATFDVSTTDVVTVALTQPLLRGAWSRYATTDQREAELQHRRQVEREREIRMNMVLDVYNAYWDLVSAREELAVRELAVELGREQLDQEQRRLDVGAGTEVDVLQSETNLAQQEEERIQAESSLRAAEDALRKLLFQEPGERREEFLQEWDWPVVPLTPLPLVTAAAEEGAVADTYAWRGSLDRAIEVRPELRQARMDVAAAEVRLQRARSNRRAQLDFELSAAGTGFSLDPGDAFDDAVSFEFLATTASLTFSLPIRNRAAAHADRAARASLRSSRLAYDSAELGVLENVRGAVRDLRYRRESVAAAVKSLALAQRQLEAEQARREIGLSTTFQVLEFQQDLAQALSAERSARASYAKAVAVLAHAEGGLGEEPESALPASAPVPGGADE